MTKLYRFTQNKTLESCGMGCEIYSRTSERATLHKNEWLCRGLNGYIQEWSMSRELVG
jgi:hypothetical protein